MNRELKHLNLTEGQVPCLMVLSKNPGITQDELAKILHIDKGTIARAVRKLEEKELLDRIQDQKNRRRYLLSLTSKGDDRIPEILSAEEKWEKLIFTGFPDEERSHVVNCVKILAKNSLELGKNNLKDNEPKIGKN